MAPDAISSAIRYEREEGEKQVHPRHLDDGKQAEEQRVAEHKHSGPEAVLNRLKVVREIAHEISDLAVLIIALGQLLAVREHPRAQVGLDLDPRAEETDAPDKPSHDHRENDEYHRQTYPVKQEVHVERERFPAVLDGARVYAVYDHFVELWNDELHIVDEYQRRETDYQSRRVAQIIPVDVFSEQQLKHLLLFEKFSRSVKMKPPPTGRLHGTLCRLSSITYF